uniref:B30.2/SPRY domain-containing protein n=1 Tax=uncultured gamma proteobacterium HF0070_03O15 TaxID=710982 RepID=E0XRP6_9GAMM|nr:hypothetical protein [uncultured gamma proteobacterium HF0070_03O15]
MSSIGSPSPFFLAGKKAYQVERSLRFNVGDNTYLSRTPSSAGNRRTWTISFWFKTEGGGSLQGQRFWSVHNDTVDGLYASFAYENDGFIAELRSHLDLRTTAVFRDPTAWYHVVLAVDTTQSTSSDRAKLYVNNTQITDFNTASYPSQNHEGGWNSTAEHNIGRELNQTRRYFGGYMTEFINIDGQQLTPSYFGETDAITGQWNPKKYVGSYGTNGFYLNFSDNSGTTATTLGKDSSGNGNNWTPSNLSVYDSMPDTPTNNFAVMNPLTNYSGLSQGNLRFNNYNDSGGNRSTQATFALPKSGKWYLEARYQEDYIHSIYMGLSQIQMNTGYVTTPTVYYNSLYGTIEATGESAVQGGTWYNIGSGNSVILSMAIDVDNNSVKFYKDNSLQGTITLPTITSLQEYFFTWANSSGGSSGSLNNTFNFGADSTFQGQETSGGNADANGIGDFQYAPASGPLALCSANLPEPTIKATL